MSQNRDYATNNTVHCEEHAATFENPTFQMPGHYLK